MGVATKQPIGLKSNFMHLRQKNRSGLSLEPSRQAKLAQFHNQQHEQGFSDKLNLQYNSSSIPYINKAQAQRKNKFAVNRAENSVRQVPGISGGHLLDSSYRIDGASSQLQNPLALKSVYA